MLKDMGNNALRTSHNPPAPEFLDMADRMGFLVMDEAFDCWDQGKNTYDYGRFFNQWSKTDVGDMVMRDRNHPGIIIGSIGNESPKDTIAFTISGPGALVGHGRQNHAQGDLRLAHGRLDRYHDRDTLGKGGWRSRRVDRRGRQLQVRRLAGHAAIRTWPRVRSDS
jgi:hypothetical protein